MSLISRVVLSLMLAAVAVAPLAATDLGQLPAEQRWLVYVDLQAVVKGQLGRWLGEVGTQSTAKARLALFTALTGIDPAKDLDSITLSGADASEDGALICIRGRFDGARLATLAQAAEGYATSAYGEHTITHWVDTKNGGHKAMNGCLVNPNLLLIAQREAVIDQALDILDGKLKATAAGAGIFDRERLNAGTPLLVAAACDMQQWAKQSPQAAMLRQVRNLMLAIAEEGPDLVLTATVTGSDAAATGQIRDLLQGLVALARLGQRENVDEIGQALIDSVQFTLDGGSLSVRARCPLAALLRSLNKIQPAAAGAAAAAGTPVK